MNISVTRTVVALTPMVIGLALAMDVYIPAIPTMTDLFHISAAEMQLTLTLFMLTSGIMQLFVGPLSDQFGRKKSAYTVIVIFAVGTLLCGTAHSVEQLILFRIIQAIGSCGMMVIAFAIVRDIFHGNKSAIVYSFLNGIIAFSPMLAPFLGSYLDIEFGWPMTFFALSLITLFAFVLYGIAMPETLPKVHRKKINSAIFKEYKKIFTNKQFLIYNFAIASGLSYLFIFCFISPYVIMKLLHIPEMHYGYYFFYMGISFFLGSLLSAFLVKRIGIYDTVVAGFYISLSGGILMTVWYFATGLSIDNFVWPMLLIGIGGTMGMGAGSGGAMEHFKDIAGAAAAVSGFLRFVFAALLGTMLVPSNVSSSLPLAIPAVILNVIGIYLFLHHKRSLKISD